MKNYRLNTEAYGTIAGTPHRVIVVRPEGSVITLVGPVEEKSDEIEVLWEGKVVWLFAEDFAARTTESGIACPQAKAASVEESKPEGTEKSSLPKVRRFNASGREL